MTTAAVRDSLSRRTASKEARREQLIQATIRSIAKHGLSDTTIATVSSEAQLSQGIINLHFQSKDRLLVETLQYVTDEYKEIWERALAQAGPSTAEQLEALLGVDYDKAVFSRDKVAVWFAFWSETKSRPTYRKLCTERDLEYDRIMVELVEKIIREGDYGPLNAEIISNGLAAMTEGLWLDFLVNPKERNRERARLIVHTYLTCLFPNHFS